MTNAQAALVAAASMKTSESRPPHYHMVLEYAGFFKAWLDAEDGVGEDKSN